MRACVPTLIVAIASIGCGAAAPAAEIGGGEPARCEGERYEGPRADPSAWGPAPDGIVYEVHVVGLSTVPERLVRAAIGDRLNAPLDPEWVREDIEAIIALEVFDDVRARVAPTDGGLSLSYEVSERPLVGDVTVRGTALPSRAAEHPRPGEVYDPTAAHRAALRLVAHHRAEGYAEATGSALATRDGDRVDLCLAIEPGRMRRIASIRPEGNERVSDDELLELLQTRGDRVNSVGGVFDEGQLADSLSLWTNLYYDRGMIEVRVGEPRGSWDDEGRFHVRVPVEEGPVFRVRRVSVEGDLSADAAAYRALVGAQEGEVFVRSTFSASIEAIYELEAERGRDRSAVEVYPETQIDADAHELSITLVVRDLRSEPPEAP